MEFDMHYYMEVEDGMVISIGRSSEPIHIEITESEYKSIRKLMSNPPSPSSKLNENLEWVLSNELTAEEALSIITGESA